MIMNKKQSPISEYDLKQAIHPNGLVGMWRLIYGYRLPYLGANLSLAGAAVFKSATFLLLRFLVDRVLVDSGQTSLLPLIGLGFVIFAGFEGLFTYFSGRLAAFTAESTTRRLREYLFDHIQRL